MKTFMKWTGIVLGGLIGLALLAGLALYPSGMEKFTRSYPNIQVEAVTIASTVYAVLMCLLPIRRIILEFGANRATSSMLVTFLLLLVGWLFYAAFSHRVELKKQQEAYI